MKKPMVSILMPIYNGANYMEEAIDSALAQSYENTEIIVINDGSNDNGATERIALNYGDRIKYVFQENQGGAGALNTGIKMMSGEFFSWLSHDDLYFPDKISAQIKTLENAGTMEAVVYSHWINIDGEGKEMGKISLPKIPPVSMFLFLLLHRRIHGCSLLIPKQAFKTVGMFDASLRSTPDYDLWLRMCRQYPFLLCDEFLVKGRSHKDQYTFAAPDHNAETERFFEKYVSEISHEQMTKGAPRKIWGQYIFDLGHMLTGRGYHRAALKLAHQIIKLSLGEDDFGRRELLSALSQGLDAAA